MLYNVGLYSIRQYFLQEKNTCTMNRTTMLVKKMKTMY
jgi:hypothetical protein